MQLTILSLGSRGDVQPYVALGRGLANAGFRVRVATFSAFEPLVRGQGLDFHPVPGDAQELVRMASGSGAFRTRNPLRMIRGIMRSYGRLVDDYVEAFSDDALSDSDAILNQLPGGLFGRDLAERLGVPHISLSVIPLAPTRAFPSPLLAARPFGGPLNRATYTFSGQLLWTVFRPANRRFRQQLGLRAPSRLFRDPPGPVVNGFSETVVPRPPDWGPNVHVTGYWTLEEPGFVPPAGLERFLEAGGPPVFVGFGSMVSQDPDKLVQNVVAGARAAGQRLVVGKGWAGLGGLSAGEDVYLAEYVPYRWLFPRMRAVVHHGGSGTTGLALRSGAPSTVVSFGVDQPYWGERVRALGCGPGPVRVQDLTAEKLAERLNRMASDQNMRARAHAIGRQLRAEDGITEAVRVIRGFI